eukprot:TRINITY_DN1984_c0_g1_i1.p1 TRINITY_DN1984_c0_g1~~TRINITY_DN1984_c0_g1_i1.p1  ORF type:complete len:426 (+),score=57.25 TRINITY_DN1984_c0_g1_i1:125-1402(+)
MVVITVGMRRVKSTSALGRGVQQVGRSAKIIGSTPAWKKEANRCLAEVAGIHSRRSQTGFEDLPDSCIEMILKKVEAATHQMCAKEPCVKSSRAAQSNLLWYARVCKDWHRLVDYAVHQLTIKAQGRPHIDRKVNQGLVEAIQRFPNLEELNLLLSGVGTVSNWGDLFAALKQACVNFHSLRLGHVDPLSAVTAVDLGLLCQSLPQLRTLSLESALDSKLKALPEVIAQLTQLQELMLYEGGIRQLPNSLADMSNLRRLELRCLSLQSLPSSIGHMQSLEALVISNCTSMTGLPDALSNLKSLRSLVIDRCGIRELPEALGELSSLEVLELKACMWLSGPLPDWLGQLRSLRKLCVWRCGLLTGFPSSVSSLTHLRDLQVDYCCLIKELPKALFELPELEVVVIDPRLCSPADLRRLPAFCKVKG